MRNSILFLLSLILGIGYSGAQSTDSPQFLTLDRIYASSEFRQESSPRIRWIDSGNSYVLSEASETIDGGRDMMKVESNSQEKSTWISASELIPEGQEEPLRMADFTFSDDESKMLIFTNTSRVWRRNTKGDYWIFDLDSRSLRQIGVDFESSSLMFAKFSPNNEFVSYVQAFNLYQENVATGEVTQLTTDGTRDIINGTFDWVYEEEFDCRDGFSYSPEGDMIAYWQLDASEIGTFYMINNTDSIYPKLIPVQYPKVGQDPSATKVGIVSLNDQSTTWIELPGGPKTHYLPGMQWINADLLLIQQINRYQNDLKIFTYAPSNGSLTEIYREQAEDSWVDLSYPDITSNGLAENELVLTADHSHFLRMTELDGWRHVYKVNISSGKKTLLTPGEYDVASMLATTDDRLLFSASPYSSVQRYLYSVDLKGKADTIRHSPAQFGGFNKYDISPNGLFAVHTHENMQEVRTIRFITLPDHATKVEMVKNDSYRAKLETLDLPEVSMTQVTTEDGITIDVRMIKPHNFDPSKKYPVLFNVYGEPWGQTAVDRQVGLWNIMLAQQGYVVINLDARGTPCLLGSEWRKSIYRQIGRMNIRDMAMGAQEILKLEYLDETRTAVWGWSGGGSSTLNLMFQYPKIFTTGMAVAPVPDQRLYDNVYQERYMGLPQDNEEDFISGSPVTHAKNLEGNLLLIHGTGDDNVHYQGSEILINELIRQNKHFQMMAYPNRSHGIYEGENTRRHIYSLLTRYLMENVEAGGKLRELE